VTHDALPEPLSNNGGLSPEVGDGEARASTNAQLERDERRRATYKGGRERRKPDQRGFAAGRSYRRSSQKADSEPSSPSSSVEEEFRQGNSKALEAIFEYYYPRLCEFVARAFTGDLEDAEDVVQNAFLRAWRTRDHLPAGISVVACLFHLSREEALNWLHKQRRRASLLGRRDAQTSVSEPVQPDDALHHQMLLDRVQRVIEGFPPKCRDVFYLRQLAGLSYGQIGEALGISIRTVEAHVYEGHRRLRELQGLR
jgi:RNA polymerase sigma-70 factor (ECF subfamily)